MTYLSPGVYIEEVPSGPQPIQAASTSVVAVLGSTRKGPVQTPTRVSGWAAFVRTFGNATARGFTAESVFGFFENGGPAAWVVRVDPSTQARWLVRDAGGTTSFAVTAASPGAWANGLEVTLAPDTAGAAGSLYLSALTAAATVSAGTVFTLPVSSTAGLRAGDEVVAIAPPDGSATVASASGTVQDLGATSVAVDFGAAVTLPAGSVLGGTVPTSTDLFVPSARGFKPGDVLVITAPNGERAGLLVSSAVETGPGMTLTLDSAPGSAVPGAAFVQRRARLRVNATVTATPAGTPPITGVSLAMLAFPGSSPKPTVADLGADGALRASARIEMGDGRAATWNAGGSRFPVPGPVAPQSGPAHVTVGVAVAPYADAGLALVDFDSADLAASYGWLPTGTSITISGAAPPTSSPPAPARPCPPTSSP